MGTHNLYVKTDNSPTSTDSPTSTAGVWGVANTAVQFTPGVTTATSSGVYGGVAVSQLGEKTGTASTFVAFNRTDYTVEAFFKLPTSSIRATSSSTPRPLGEDRKCACGSPATRIQYLSFPSSGMASITGTGGLTAGVWYYAAVSVTSNAATLYLYNESTKAWSTFGRRTSIGTDPGNATQGYYTCIGAGISRGNWSFCGAYRQRDRL